MRHIPNAVVVLIVILVPLAFLPAWSFYYDVTPKAVVLLAGSAMLCGLAAWDRWKFWKLTSRGTSPKLIETSQSTRWNVFLNFGLIATILISVAASPYVSLAWSGSTWRRSGAVVQIATLIAALLTATITSRSKPALLHLFRALCLAGALAALYGALQYFGWDPFLAASDYQFGESPHQIVRPPGPMGHSNYLAAFLLWPLFVGVVLFRIDPRPWGRSLGLLSASASCITVLLCGSRGAMLGLAAGSIVLLATLRPRLQTVLVACGTIALIAGIFYISPAGEQLRARVFWIGEDSAGGSRLLLWRDSFRMATAHPWVGFGPDTFAAAFPQSESAELARAYPDFYHESPHNMFLDVLTGQGAIGLALLIGSVCVGLRAAMRALKTSDRAMASALLAGLAATLITHQFAVLIIPTAFMFWLSIGLLTNLDSQPPIDLATIQRRPNRFFDTLTTAWATTCLLLASCALQLASADLRLARVRNLLDASQPLEAARAWTAVQQNRTSLPLSGLAADLYFSQRWTTASLTAKEIAAKVHFAQLAANAAIAATQAPEQRANAWYNLALLQASADDPRAVESSLRAAILFAPSWFKPHWSLARLLHLTSKDSEEARREANLARDLNGGHDPEVAATTEKILRSASTAR